MARQAQGHKPHHRQAPKGGKNQKPKGEAKLEDSCSSGQSWVAAATLGLPWMGYKEPAQPEYSHPSPPIMWCRSGRSRSHPRTVLITRAVPSPHWD